MKLPLGVDVAVTTGEIPPRSRFLSQNPVHRFACLWAAACGPLSAAVAGWIVKWLTVAPAMRIVRNVRWMVRGREGERCISGCLTLDVMTV